MVEIVVVGAIIIFVLIYNNTIDKSKFIADNEKYFDILREEDYNFLVYARYGEEVDPNILFRKRRRANYKRLHSTRKKKNNM